MAGRAAGSVSTAARRVVLCGSGASGLLPSSTSGQMLWLVGGAAPTSI